MSDNQTNTPDYNTLNYFKSVMNNHDKVSEFKYIDEQYYEIIRTFHEPIFLYITNLYTVGITDCRQFIDEHPTINCIVTLSNWNGYTEEAKEFTKRKSIGLFILNEFMGALHKNDFWNYVKKDDNKKS